MLSSLIFSSLVVSTLAASSSIPIQDVTITSCQAGVSDCPVQIIISTTSSIPIQDVTITSCQAGVSDCPVQIIISTTSCVPGSPECPISADNPIGYSSCIIGEPGCPSSICVGDACNPTPSVSLPICTTPGQEDCQYVFPSASCVPGSPECPISADLPILICSFPEQSGCSGVFPTSSQGLPICTTSGEEDCQYVSPSASCIPGSPECPISADLPILICSFPEQSGCSGVFPTSTPELPICTTLGEEDCHSEFTTTTICTFGEGNCHGGAFTLICTDNQQPGCAGVFPTTACGHCSPICTTPGEDDCKTVFPTFYTGASTDVPEIVTHDNGVVRNGVGVLGGVIVAAMLL